MSLSLAHNRSRRCKLFHAEPPCLTYIGPFIDGALLSLEPKVLVNTAFSNTQINYGKPPGKRLCLESRSQFSSRIRGTLGRPEWQAIVFVLITTISEHFSFDNDNILVFRLPTALPNF